ncbi:MAG: hypothetical protein CFE43_20945 [Burkholderiales bacterium PBB3]|nr:MAG: hypothetical protein CFE43_20945 [Burkholderiales bacterium PBB3]
MQLFELTLSKGPKLVYQHSDRGGDPLDVTDRSAEYLFRSIYLEDNVTLGDVLQLLDNPVMRTVFRHEYANELLEEASLGPVEKDEPAPVVSQRCHVETS